MSQTTLLLAVADAALGSHLAECVTQLGAEYSSQHVTTLPETVYAISQGVVDVAVVDLAMVDCAPDELLQTICSAAVLNGPGIVVLASSSPRDVNAVASVLRDCNVVILYRDDIDSARLLHSIRLAQTYRTTRPMPDDPTLIAQVLAAMRHSEVPRGTGARIAVGPVEMALTGVHAKLDRVLGELGAVVTRLRQVEQDARDKGETLIKLRRSVRGMHRKFATIDQLVHGDTAAKVAPLESRISELERVHVVQQQREAQRSKTLREVLVGAAPHFLIMLANGLLLVLTWAIVNAKIGVKP